jgi:hypothetical protein
LQQQCNFTNASSANSDISRISAAYAAAGSSYAASPSETATAPAATATELAAAYSAAEALTATTKFREQKQKQQPL